MGDLAILSISYGTQNSYCQIPHPSNFPITFLLHFSQFKGRVGWDCSWICFHLEFWPPTADFLLSRGFFPNFPLADFLNNSHGFSFQYNSSYAFFRYLLIFSILFYEVYISKIPFLYFNHLFTANVHIIDHFLPFVLHIFNSYSIDTAKLNSNSHGHY